MLIGFHSLHERTDQEWAETAASLIPYLEWAKDRRGNPVRFDRWNIRVVKPETLEQYTDIIHKYRPKRIQELLIIVTTHYELLDADDIASFRYYEQAFDRRGGSIWGDAPVKFTDAPITYSGTLDDIPKIASTTKYLMNRGRQAYDLTASYFGRYSVTPHTVVVGVMNAFPHRSVLHNALLTSLAPDWWSGVAQVRSSVDRAVRPLSLLEGTSLVTLTDVADGIATNLGYEHGKFVLPEYKYAYDKNYLRSYGANLRRVAESEPYLDLSDWTYGAAIS